MGFISTLSSTGDVEDLPKPTAFSEMLEGLSEEKRREERLKLSRTWGVGWLEKSLVGNRLKPQVVIFLEGGTYHAVKNNANSHHVESEIVRKFDSRSRTTDSGKWRKWRFWNTPAKPICIHFVKKSKLRHRQRG